jgi:hypothetical protein
MRLTGGAVSRLRRSLDEAKASGKLGLPTFITIVHDRDRKLTSPRVATIRGETFRAAGTESTSEFHARLMKLAMRVVGDPPLIAIGPEDHDDSGPLARKPAPAATDGSGRQSQVRLGSKP